MSDEKKHVVDPKATVEEQIKQAELASRLMELEAKQLEIEERKYHIQDLRARLADRDIVEKQAKEDREQQGRTFAQQDATDKYRWSTCSHKKGGNVSPRDMRVLSTGGNASQFAVAKHQMINGDIWVRCLRCGRTWNPPVEINFYFNAEGKQVSPTDGTFNRAKFDKAVEEYQTALMFSTNNTMSTSVQCRFSRFDTDSKKMVDAADVYREGIASSNLR